MMHVPKTWDLSCWFAGQTIKKEKKGRGQFSVLKESQEDTSKNFGTKQDVIKTFFLTSDVA